MSKDILDHSGKFLSRWSRRKLAAAREPALPGAQAPTPAVPALGTTGAPDAVAPAAAATPTTTAPALPALETLTFESDFTAFLQPGVEPGVQRAALRKLLHDPRFNAMDGLDVYIDDYTKPSPLDPAIARVLADAQAMLMPRVEPVDAPGPAQDVDQSGADSAGVNNRATSPALSRAARDEAPPAAGSAAPQRPPGSDAATSERPQPRTESDT
jgi:hypothetical protein